MWVLIQISRLEAFMIYTKDSDRSISKEQLNLSF